MKKKLSLFEINAYDKVILKGQSFTIDDAIASLLIIHGLGEHQQRYRHVVDAMNAAKINCFTFDIRGHGISGGQRGHIPTYNILLEDIISVIEQIKTESKQTPLFLFGHSMGGNIVGNFILRKNAGLKGAILSSPWITLEIKPPVIEILLANLIRKIWPAMSRPTNLNPEFLSHDKEVVKQYIEDPLVHSKITPSLFLSLKKGGEYILANAKQVNIPMLITHGDEDKLTSASSSRKVAGLNGANFHLWKGMYHEPHNEIEKEKVINFYISWIKKNIKAES